MGSVFCHQFCNRGTAFAGVTSSCHKDRANVNAVAACATRCSDAGLQSTPLAKQEVISIFAPDTQAVESSACRLRPAIFIGLTDLADFHRSLDKRPLTLQFRI
jgi:hypothetical protein